MYIYIYRNIYTAYIYIYIYLVSIYNSICISQQKKRGNAEAQEVDGSMSGAKDQDCEHPRQGNVRPEVSTTKNRHGFCRQISQKNTEYCLWKGHDFQFHWFSGKAYGNKCCFNIFGKTVGTEMMTLWGLPSPGKFTQITQKIPENPIKLEFTMSPSMLIPFILCLLSINQQKTSESCKAPNPAFRIASKLHLAV